MTMNDKLTKLPAYIIEEAKLNLRYGLPAYVIRRNRRLEVVDSLRNGYAHTDDERFVCMITDADVFTETERIENYINLYHKYPENYRGVRDETVLARLDDDMEYDSKTGELRLPRGRMDGDNFVYAMQIESHT